MEVLQKGRRELAAGFSSEYRNKERAGIAEAHELRTYKASVLESAVGT